MNTNNLTPKRKHNLTKRMLLDYGYDNVRQLDDGTWIGTQELFTTTALFIGLDETGWNKRYCYDDIDKLFDSYLTMNSIADVPRGWIAMRG